MPSSVLTRWLRQGLERGMCPLCRVAHKADREYMWYFFDERSSDEAVLDEVAAARGLCPEHAEQLRLIEVEGTKSTIGISDVYLHVLERLEADLAALSEAAANIRHLLAEIEESPALRERLESSAGLCVPHFQLVLAAAPADAARELLIGVELSAVRSLSAELREHLRRQRAEFSHEPPGHEVDSWQRAVWLTGGWPPAWGHDIGPEE